MRAWKQLNLIKTWKAYSYIGCYGSKNSYADVFTETLTMIQCSNAAANLSMTCLPFGTSNVVFSALNMTIDACFQICSSNGFTYAGLAL